MEAVSAKKGASELSHAWRSKEDLREELERRLRDGACGEVRFDRGERALYATDASNYRQIPLGVVLPRHIGDVTQALRVASELKVPILARGGGTSLAGQCCNEALVLDLSKHMRRIQDIDPLTRTAYVEPGTILDDLRRESVAKYGLTYGPDPATHTHCTFGGMIGNNSCGVRSVLASREGTGPRTSDNIVELDVLTYRGLRLRVGPTSDTELRRIIAGGGERGRIYSELKQLRDRYASHIRQRFPDIPRRVSGYNLDELLPEKGFNVARALVGTEGTCVTILGARIRLIPAPPKSAVLLLGFPDVFVAADQVMKILPFGPAGLEGFDETLTQNVRKKALHAENLELLPKGKGFLLVETTGEDEEMARAAAQAIATQLIATGGALDYRIYSECQETEKVWDIRESGLGATARVPGDPDTWPGWEDSAVAPERLGDYLREFRKVLMKYEYNTASLYGHFGDGCIHTRIPFDLKSKAGIDTYRAFAQEMAHLCVRFGGSLSGEHGDGQSRAELLEIIYGQELVDAFGQFRSIWDPDGKMNPGKVVGAYRISENLRLGGDYHPVRIDTHFKFPEDQGDFARATTRCVGVGKCRRMNGGTMCPSYMVTSEEKHSTRGRAHLLFEMLQGDSIEDGWQSEAVKEALDLCLSCKGCKSDCPVNVDLATYKAEFLSHYYEHKSRPVSAFSMGLIHFWSQVAARMPGIANYFTQTPVIRDLAKKVAGIARERDLPAYAPETFQHWFKNRNPVNPNGPPVLLWPDTFNNHFHTETAKAAVTVLEGAGFHVQVPQAFLCCGRPLYEYGMLDLAKKQLRQILECLQKDIRAGVPMVGLEPSCTAVFRDELKNLFPNDEDAIRLSRQTMTLAEFLEAKASEMTLPKMSGQVMIHGHCHHKSIIGMDADQRVLRRMGLDVDLLDSGCCGMAGAFGFEREKYDVSIRAGERVLLPKVRGAARDTIILTDGFSCKTQIEQGSNRRALHLATVIAMGMEDQDSPNRRLSEPEHRYPQPIARPVKIPAYIAAAAVVGVALPWISRRLRKVSYERSDLQDASPSIDR